MAHGHGGDGPVFVEDGVVHSHNAEISGLVSGVCVTGWAYYGCYLYELYIKEQTGGDTFVAQVHVTVYGGPKRQGRTLLMRLQTIQPKSQMLRTLRVAAAVFLAFAA